MASNEEYLDNLLKTITTESEEQEAEEETKQHLDSDDLDMSDMDALLGAITGDEDAPALQDVMQMSEDDINRMLESNKTASSGSEEVKEEVPDLSDLLGSEDNDDLQEITNLLKKSDNNEAVDAELLAKLEKIPDEDKVGPFAENMQGTSNSEEPAKETAKSRREKRAAEKKAKKEAKLAAKLEKKKKKLPKNKAEQASQETQQNSEPSVNLEDIPEGTTAASTAPETSKSKEDSEEGLSGDISLDNLFLNDGEEPVAVSLEEALQEDSKGTKEDPKAEKEESKTKKEESKGKKGFFGKIIEFLTEEDEEEQPKEQDEAESLNLSDENKAILAAMNKEGKEDKKSTKKKKEKKKKEKPKKEKKPKVKKVKPPKPASEAEKGLPEKKISIKKIIPIGAIAASILMVLLISSNLSVDYVDRKNAELAFRTGDYQSCYQDLFGKDLNETEELMYHKSEYILRMRLYLREYEFLSQQGLKVEALDNLIQTVEEYPTLREEANQWDAINEMDQIYQQILTILSENYFLTEEQTKEIAAQPDDLEYTKMVTAVASGESLDESKSKGQDTNLPDALPEEEDLPDTSFVENNL